MSIFKRLRDITAATVNDMIDKAEDPIKMLNQFMRDMEQEIADAEIAVAKQIAIEKKFKRQYEEAEEMVVKREEQAMKALEAGDEGLARRALQDKKEYHERVAEFKKQFDNAKGNADQLRAQLSDMKEEYENLKRKKDTLIARAEAAKAQKQINQMSGGIGKQNAAKGFERIADKVLQLEAEAEASKEFNVSNRSLDAELDALDDDGVEDELAALKAKLAEKKEITS